jgi:hypothetical protein
VGAGVEATGATVSPSISARRLSRPDMEEDNPKEKQNLLGATLWWSRLDSAHTETTQRSNNQDLVSIGIVVMKDRNAQLVNQWRAANKDPMNM